MNNRRFNWRVQRNLVCWLLLLVLGGQAFEPAATLAASVRHDLFVRSFSDGGSLQRLHGNNGQVLYSEQRFGGFYLTTGPDGQIYLPAAGVILRIASEFEGSFCRDCIMSVGGTVNGTGVAFGTDGAFYSASGQRIIRTNLPETSRPSLFGQSSPGTANRFEAITFGPDGNLYANDGAATIWRFDGSSGNFLGMFASHPSLIGARGMAFGEDGKLYVAGVISDNVVRFDGTTGMFDSVFTSGIDGANGLAFAPHGDLFVGSEIDRKIVRVDAATGAVLGDFATGLSGIPVGMTFAPIPVPEPMSASLLAMALLCGTAAISRRKAER